MFKTFARTANKLHWCDCGTVIKSGDRYLEHVISPDHDGMGNLHWQTIQECKECSTRYGRGELLD